MYRGGGYRLGRTQLVLKRNRREHKARAHAEKRAGWRFIVCVCVRGLWTVCVPSCDLTVPPTTHKLQPKSTVVCVGVPE